MKLSQKNQQLQALILPAVEACNVVLWGLDFMPQGKRSLLRVYIDVDETHTGTPKTDEEGGRGVGVEDCVAVSQQIGALLDVHNPIAGEYTLEVSSPGWDRQFYQIEQMRPYIGQNIHLRLVYAMDNRRKITGQLTDLNDETLTIIVDGTAFAVDINNIDKANLVYQDEG